MRQTGKGSGNTGSLLYCSSSFDFGSFVHRGSAPAQRYRHPRAPVPRLACVPASGSSARCVKRLAASRVVEMKGLKKKSLRLPSLQSAYTHHGGPRPNPTSLEFPRLVHLPMLSTRARAQRKAPKTHRSRALPRPFTSGSIIPAPSPSPLGNEERRRWVRSGRGVLGDVKDQFSFNN